MQSGPQFQFAPTWLALVVILAAGLTFIAFVAVLTALFAAGKPIVPLQRIKTLAAMLLLIVPALGFVFLIGWFWAVPVPSVSHSESRTASMPRPEMHVGGPVEMRKNERPESAVDAMHKVRLKAEATDENSSTDRRAEAAVTSTGAVVAIELSAPDERQSPRADQLPINAEKVEETSSASAEAVRQAGVLTDVLRVRGTASAPPDWEGKGPVPSNDGVLVALSSQRFATIGEAEEQVTALAVNCVKKFYSEEYPLSGDWTVPVSMIQQNSLNAMVGEMFEKDFGNGVREKMYRAHLQLDLNPALRRALHASWNEQLVTRRLWKLGGGLALATSILAIFAGYFRLDDWTGGRYRRRLKLAGVSLFAAGSLVASACVFFA